MQVELHPEARAELRDAALWYDDRRPRLGDEFIAEVSRTLSRITEVPSSFPAWPGIATTARTIRQAVIRRFPYSVAFEVHSNHILVLAIAHSKRRPLYWLDRAY